MVFHRRNVPDYSVFLPVVEKEVSKGKGKQSTYCLRLRHKDKNQKVKSCRFGESKRGISALPRLQCRGDLHSEKDSDFLCSILAGSHEYILLASSTQQEMDSWYTIIQKNIQYGTAPAGAGAAGSSSSPRSGSSSASPVSSPLTSPVVPMTQASKPKDKLTERKIVSLPQRFVDYGMGCVRRE